MLSCSIFVLIFATLVLLQGAPQMTTPSIRNILSSLPTIPTALPKDRHLCLLNYPKNEYCQNWRVLPLIILTNKSTAKKNFDAIKQFLTTVTEYCGNDSFLMPFIPSYYNSNCSQYQLRNGTNWISTVTLSDVFNDQDSQEAVRVFEDLMTTLYNCTLEMAIPVNEAGAIFVFHDFQCETLFTSGTFFNKSNQDLFGLSITKYVTTINSLGNYNLAARSCMETLFGYCSILFRQQICGLKYYSNPNDLINSSYTQHTCEPDVVPGTQAPSGPDTGLILEIVLPCVLGTIILAIGIVICVVHRSRRTWFKFWWEHTKGESFINGPNQKDYFDVRTMEAKRRKDHWEINPKFLKMKEDDPLGHGAFAIVYKGILTDNVPLLSINSSVVLQIEGKVEGGYEVAVKKLPNHADDRSRSDFLKEMDFMKALGYHIHIMRLLIRTTHVSQIKFCSLLGCISNPMYPLIITEYCSNGDLLKFLRKHKEDFNAESGVLSVKNLLSFSWQVSDGMVYLCSKNFIHRDVAARNILLTANLIAKIGDFGLCREVDAALYSSQGGRLPIKWMAIESLKYYEYTTKSDVWSFGVLLFEIFTLGEGPFQAIQPADMISHLEEGKRLSQPQHCQNEMYELMKRCWLIKAEERPTFEEIRENLASILHQQDSHYGYLTVERKAKEEA